jgi:hypothetical protein
MVTSGFIFDPEYGGDMLLRNTPACSRLLGNRSDVFDLEDGDRFLRNVGSHTDYTVLYSRRWQPLTLPL